MQARTSYGTELDKLFEDYPLSGDGWRMNCDAWLQVFGRSLFREDFFAGFRPGYTYINKCLAAPVLDARHVIALNAHLYFFEPDSYNACFHDHNKYGGYELMLTAPYIMYAADVSLDGIEGLADNLIHAHNPGIKLGKPISKDSNPALWNLAFNGYGKHELVRINKKPENFAKLEIVDMSQFYLDEKKNIDRAKLVNFLKDRFTSKKYDDKFVKLNEIFCCHTGVPHEEAKKYITKSLTELDEEIKKIKSENKDAQDQIIAAIVKVIQRLHLAHFFKDGNGRTLIFGLKNLLLMRYLNTWSLTSSPNHFSGFSHKELVTEIKQDIALFQEFKITRAREYLDKLSIRDLNRLPEVTNQLRKELSSSPMIALAQINELFLRVKERSVLNPAQASYEAALFKTQVTQLRAKTLTMLKQLYFEKICELVKLSQQGSESGLSTEAKSRMPLTCKVNFNVVATREAFESILEKHAIVQDHLFPCNLASLETQKLSDIIAPQLTEYQFMKKFSAEMRMYQHLYPPKLQSTQKPTIV